MKKQKIKLAVLFLALSCASVGIGAGTIASVNASKPNVTASAETTYTEYSVSNLIVHEHSTAARPDLANASSLWLFGTGDMSDAWADYTYVSGEGVKLNGETITAKVQDFSNGLYLSFDAVNVGDVISIGGVYANSDRAIKYNISKGSFKWNGSGWEKYVEYTEYNVSKLSVHIHSTAGNPNSNNTTVWLFGTGDTSDKWADYTCVSGDGIKLNGEAITARVQDFSNGLYLSFDGVNAGDVISIGGTFVNETRAIKYNIPESEFQWNGSGWESFVEYTTHEVGVIEPNPNSANVGAPGARPDHLYTVDVSKLPVQDWDAPFLLDSGYGIKINGEAVTSFEMKSTDGGLWFGLAGVQTNDVVSICGTFKCEHHAIKYVIEESKMVWNGSTWEKYVEYTTHEIGALKLSVTPSAANLVFLFSVNGEKMPVDSWEHVFRFRQGSGTGLTLNGEALNTNDIKSPGGDLYIGFGSKTAQEGDVLVIGGTFYCVNLAVEYIIADSTFIFENSAWISAFDKVKIAAKEELTAYKNEFSQEDYYEAEWASFDTIIAEGVANVDAAMTDEEVEAAVAAAKAEMDEVVTKVESDAIFNELKVSAKDDLAAYKSENDYRAADWAAIQAILEKANTEIDASESVTAINTAVANAKAEMDAVKTDAQWVADEGVVEAAKAELAAYKNESDYKAAEWTAIQAIITQANGDIDNAIGNEEAINGIVAAAKAEMDKVKTAKVVAEDEVRAYYNAIDHDLYSEEAEEIISGYIAEVMAAIDSATTNEELDAAIAQFKTKVESVETLKPAGDSGSTDEDKTSSGCGSSLALGGVSASVALAAAVAMLLKKKED